MIELARSVGAALTAGGHRLITAESCTGGMLASMLTAVPGSSDWFEGAYVTYRVSAKVDMLGIDPALVDRFTAVSEPVARDMAIGAIARSRADLSVAITGIAGPAGGDIMIPVGTVWFGWAWRTDAGIECLQTAEHTLEGDREQVRITACHIALEGLLAITGAL